jgi:hypothetical protein
MDIRREEVSVSSSHGDDAVWRHLADSYKIFSNALAEFLTENVDRIGIMRVAFHTDDRKTAIYMLRYLSAAELEQLFDELVILASYSHGAVQTVREVILTLPKDWVLSNIENAAEPLLTTGTYDEYRRLIELYMQIDNELAYNLAQRAAQHLDPEIKEAGEDFLEKIGPPANVA